MLTTYFFQDEKEEWRWHIKAANGRIIADSGEGYKNWNDALRGFYLLKRSIANAVIDPDTTPPTGTEK